MINDVSAFKSAPVPYELGMQEIQLHILAKFFWQRFG